MRGLSSRWYFSTTHRIPSVMNQYTDEELESLIERVDALGGYL